MKRIFIGIDGTAKAAFYDTFYGNVYRMNLAIAARDRDRTPQLFIYFSGVGATARKYLDILGRAFGQGIDEIVLQAYVNLVANYEPGDKIYVFGFSRGAVAARALTGLISHSGLVRYDRSARIRAAWYDFLGRAEAGNYQADKPNVTFADVGIEFLGVWDSVYGIDSELALHQNLFTELRFRNFDLDGSVKNGVHLLAVDDTRRLFHPMLWDKTSDPAQKMEQIWMPGVHSDIGGGYEKAFLSTTSVLAMIDKLAQYCPEVEFDRNYIAAELLPKLSEPVVVNDEWEHDLDIPFGDQLSQLTDRLGTSAGSFQPLEKARRCDNTNPLLNQSAHPLLAAATGRNVAFKKQDAQRYAPSFVLVNADAALPATAFAPDSYYSTKVKDAVSAKFR
jgi:hypothetical protein